MKTSCNHCIVFCFWMQKVWRQTTWSGWLIRQLQWIGKQCAPFFIWLYDIISGTNETDDSTIDNEITVSKLLYSLFLKSATITICILTVVGFLKLVSKSLGKEIVIVEEIMIDDDDEDHNNNTTVDNNQRKLSSNNKKQRRKKKEN